jgi:hypothetical protein
MQRADGRTISRLYRIPVSGRGVKAKRRANEKPRARVYRAAGAFVLALALAAAGAVMRKLVHLELYSRCSIMDCLRAY